MVGEQRTGIWASDTMCLPVAHDTPNHIHNGGSGVARCSSRYVAGLGVFGWSPEPSCCEPLVQRPKRRSRRELATTLTLEKAMAAPAITGLSRPAAASGMAAVL